MDKKVEVNGEEHTELYRKHRPKKLNELVGQPGAVKALEKMISTGKIPHAILLTGPSGCGKTTAARILRRHLKCGRSDFNEINAAESRGIDTIRTIQSRMNLAPMGGDTRIWLLDEAGKLTGDAQSGLLKTLEDPPRHCYFMLATTDPQKLLSTIKTRCTEIAMKPLGIAVLRDLAIATAQKEGVELSKEVAEKVAEYAEGSARKALVLLHQILFLEDEEAQLGALEASDTKRQAIELARLLIKPRVQWSEVAKLLKGLDEDAESLRRMILGYCSAVLLGGGKLSEHAAAVMDEMRDHLYDSGKPGLVLCCYRAVHR